MKLLSLTIAFILAEGSPPPDKTDYPDSREICFYPPDSGPCSTLGSHWFFNTTSSQCEKLSDGGCGMSVNSFQSRQECEGACMDCSSPMEKGPCKMYILVYGFNTTTQRCESFIFGGCRGNHNRYSNEDECIAVCE